MRKGRLFLTFIMLFMFGLMSTQAQQQEKPQLEVPILKNGDVVDDFLSGDVQTRLYMFNATEGDSVTIAMTQIDDGLDPFLVLLGPSGQVIASDDDSGKKDYSALIKDVELPATGLYFVVASSFEYIDTILDASTDTELNYELTIDGITEPDDKAASTYFGSDIADGDTLTGNSTVDEPVFYFTFEGHKGDVVDINMSSDEFDTILHVFAPGGARIAVNDDIKDGDTNSEIKGLELPEDGIYLIFATDVFFYSAGDTETQLQFTGGQFQISLNFE